MADEIIQSLGLQITADATEAENNIMKVANALLELRRSVSGTVDTVNTINTLANSLKTFSEIKITSSMTKKMADIANATKGITPQGAESLNSIATGISEVNEALTEVGESASFVTMQENVAGADAVFRELNTSIAITALSAKQLDEYFSRLSLDGIINTHSIGIANAGLAEIIKKLVTIKALTRSLEIAPVVNNAPRLPEYSSASTARLPEYSQASLPYEIQDIAESIPEINATTKATDNLVLSLEAISSAADRAGERIKNGFILYDNVINEPITGPATSQPLGPIRTFAPNIDLNKTSGYANALAINMDRASESGNRLKSALDSVSKSKFGKSVKDFANGLKELHKKTLGSQSAIGRLFHSIKRIATYRAIRAALKAITSGFKEGIDNLYKWSDAFDKTREFANSMDRISTAVLYLKNSLGALVAPIVNAVAPAFDFLIDKIVGVINHINEFISALTGASTYTVAKKVANTYGEIAEGAGNAAKAIKSFTIGIDELNIIEDNKGSGSGVGGADKVAEDWFEKREVSNKMQDFASKVREVAEQVRGYLEYMVSGEGIGDLGEWGATHIVEPVVKAWENVKGYWEYMTSGEGWGDVAEKVGNWGADGIEGLAMAWDDLKVAILKALDPLVEKGFEIANSIKKFFSNIYDSLSTLAQGALKQFKKLEPYFKLASGLAGGILGLKNSSQGAQEQGENDARSYTSGFESTLKTWFVTFATPYGALLGNTTSKSAENAKNYVRPSAMSLGTSIINGIKDGASANASSLYSKIGSIGSSALSTFKSNASYSSFKSAGENIVDGIIAGLDSKKGKIYNSISVMASKTGSSFNYTLKIQSPSKFFMESGKYIDEGLALGIDNNAYKVENSVSKLSKQFTDFRPTIDTSNLALPDAQDFTSDIQGRIKSNATISVQNQTDAMEKFLTETLMPVVTRIADDTKRTADKDANIYMDGRKVTSTINRQNRNNGFSFT